MYTGTVGRRQEKERIVYWWVWFRFRFMVFSTTFINISVISWRSVLLVEETRVPGEKHRPVTSNWQTLSHNVVSSTPRLRVIQTHNVRSLLKTNIQTIPKYLTNHNSIHVYTSHVIFKYLDNFHFYFTDEKVTQYGMLLASSHHLLLSCQGKEDQTNVSIATDSYHILPFIDKFLTQLW